MAQDNQHSQDEPRREGERIAKVMARAGMCSRREAEAWITDGRVTVNGEKLATPAFVVTAKDRIAIDGEPLPLREPTRLWLHNKPRGLVTSAKDPEGRKTVFSALPDNLPRVISVGRLDINTEGLLLLTNDGGLARQLELPATGWLRRYRVRVHGAVDDKMLEPIRKGVTLEGVRYGEIEAKIDRKQGTNTWLTLGLREGKNREIKKLMESLDLSVTRLIRISYGPFQLGELAVGAVEEIKSRILADQLGERITNAAGAVIETVRDAGNATPWSAKPAKRPAGKPQRKPRPKTDREPERDIRKPGRPSKSAKPGSHAHRRRTP